MTREAEALQADPAIGQPDGDQAGTQSGWSSLPGTGALAVRTGPGPLPGPAPPPRTGPQLGPGTARPCGRGRCCSWRCPQQ